jgi:hypothetical protein
VGFVIAYPVIRKISAVGPSKMPLNNGVIKYK